MTTNYECDDTYLEKQMEVPVIAEKAPNVQKAFLHLKELMQADDPFAN
jgi:hypothetical protein